MKTRDIIHLDMDAYFASIEQRDVPMYQGKPVLICHTDDPSSIRGVVSSASYEARPFGVKSGMSVLEAKRLCPRGIYIGGNYEKYLSNTQKIIAICKRYSDLVEVFSVDEVFIDVTCTKQLLNEPVLIAKSIQEDIKKELGLSASLGVGPSKLVAKMGSEFEKPAGITLIIPSDLPGILAPLPVGDMIGIGRKMKRRLESIGIITIGDLAKAGEKKLKKQFGIVGYYLHRASLGIDNNPVSPKLSGTGIKSFGHSSALGRGVSDLSKLTQILLGLCEGATRRMRKKKYSGRTVTLRLCLARLFSITRSITLGDFSNLTNRIYPVAKNLLLKERDLVVRYPPTLIGISVSNLRQDTKGKQVSIFDLLHPRELALTEVVDKIRDKYGERMVVRCRLIGWEREYHAVPKIELTQSYSR